MLAANLWGTVSLVAATAITVRVLNEADYTQFLVYWSLLFGAMQIVTGMQNEATRAVSEVQLTAGTPTASLGARIMAMPIILGGGLAVIEVLLGLKWAHYVGIGWLVLAVSVLVIVNYGCAYAVGGVLAGRHQWGTLAFLNALEPTVRICAVGIVAWLAPSLKSMQLAAVLPALAWLFTILPLWRVREATGARGDVAVSRLLSNGVWAMFAAAASAVLLNAFPAIVRVALGSDTSGVASLLLGVQLTRAPLMMPVAAFQGIAIAGFVAARQNRVRALIEPFAAVVGLGVLLAGAAALVGPFLMRLLFGAEYALSSAVLGGLTFAAVSIALLTLSGTATIAVGSHRAFMAGWITGAVATVVLLFTMPLPPAVRVITAVLVGPLFGVAVHLFAVRHHDGAADV